MSSSHAAPFPTTDWILVTAAARADRSRQDLSLDELVRRYVPALRRFARHQLRVSETDVDDLLQAFVTDKLVERRLLDLADRRQGRFRNLLIASLQRFAVDRYRRDHAKSRHPGDGALTELTEDVSGGTRGEPATAFDLAWAQSVVREALDRTRRKLTETKREVMWSAFSSRLLREGGEDAPIPSYAELVTTYGFDSPVQAANAMITAKRVFARKLRDVLLEYAGPDADPTDELADLRRILDQSRA